MHRHAGGDLVQLAELRHPKVFVEVEVAVVRLRGACVRPQEVQRRAARQDDRIARELDVGRRARELRDVLLEDVRLSLARRQEDLIAVGVERVDERLAREVPRRTDLPRFQDVARALIAVPIPDFLIVEQRIAERFDDALVLFVADFVTGRTAFRAGVARRNLRIQVRFLPRLVVLAHAREPLDLAAEQVDFLIVRAVLLLLRDQHHQAHFERCLDALDGRCVLPLFAAAPRRDGRGLDVEMAGDRRDAPALPIERARDLAHVVFELMGVRSFEHAAKRRPPRAREHAQRAVPA
ncbi:hypothetical protein X997_6401 [Burkholderia pseudomallei A79C]|nr:hypothetical protein X997_6401 [Burkholderia pseudomallei A79C]